jgi:Leucine-rich repeat (LRR) protein
MLKINNFLVKDSKLWKWVDYSLHRNVKESSFLKGLKVFGPHVKTLTLCQCKNISEVSWLEMINVCKNLEELDISGCYITTTELTCLIENCRNIKRLSISEN